MAGLASPRWLTVAGRGWSVRLLRVPRPARLAGGVGRRAPGTGGGVGGGAAGRRLPPPSVGGVGATTVKPFLPPGVRAAGGLPAARAVARAPPLVAGRVVSAPFPVAVCSGAATSASS